MANTRRVLVMETTGKGEGSNGSRSQRGLKAKLAAGVAILGCVAAIAFGGTHLGHATRANPSINVAHPATSTFIFSPIGRTGPSDEYLQADFANALPIPRRTGPADEYTQEETAPTPQIIIRTGPADEYDH